MTASLPTTETLPADTNAIPAESAVAGGAKSYASQHTYSAPNTYSAYPETSQPSADQGIYDTGYDRYLTDPPYFYAQPAAYLTIQPKHPDHLPPSRPG